jgi:hypothetical protein
MGHKKLTPTEMLRSQLATKDARIAALEAQIQGMADAVWALIGEKVTDRLDEVKDDLRDCRARVDDLESERW